MDGIGVRIQGEPDVIGEISDLVQSSDEAELLRVEQDDTGGIGPTLRLKLSLRLLRSYRGCSSTSQLFPSFGISSIVTAVPRS
jgi:hypothetical protein